jgi:orotidine-5'-phosphate decarboxylase
MKKDKLEYAKDTIDAFANDMKTRGFDVIVVVITSKDMLTAIEGNSITLCPAINLFIEKFVLKLSIENRIRFMTELLQKMRPFI